MKLAFDNNLELIQHPEVDLVVVAVNVTQHNDIVLAALEAGKMVYCEWPLGRNLAEAEAMAALARKKEIRTVIGLQGRFAPDIWGINGTEGDVIISAEKGYANMGPLTLRAARKDSSLEVLPVPEKYRLAPAGLSDIAINVASLYRQFAHNLENGTALAPDFDAAVRRHRLIHAVEQANVEGRRRW